MRPLLFTVDSIVHFPAHNNFFFLGVPVDVSRIRTALDAAEWGLTRIPVRLEANSWLKTGKPKPQLWWENETERNVCFCECRNHEGRLGEESDVFLNPLPGSRNQTCLRDQWIDL
jgi:hypothetical protein